MAYGKLGFALVALVAGCGGKVLGSGTLGATVDSGVVGVGSDSGTVGRRDSGRGGSQDGGIIIISPDSGIPITIGDATPGFDAIIPPPPPPPGIDASVGCPPLGEIFLLGAPCTFQGQCTLTVDLCKDGTLSQLPMVCGPGGVTPPPGVGFGCSSSGDGGVIVIQDSGVTIDGGPVSTTINCGTTTCDSTTQECCLSFQGGAAASCVAQGSCAGLPLTCTGTSNCVAGEVCCASFAAGGASCQASCGGGGGLGGSFQLCTGDADCPAGDTCRMSPLGTGICRGGFGGGGGGGGGAPGH